MLDLHVLEFPQGKKYGFLLTLPFTNHNSRVVLVLLVLQDSSVQVLLVYLSALIIESIASPGDSEYFLQGKRATFPPQGNELDAI